jgi:hypothetical protein
MWWNYNYLETVIYYDGAFGDRYSKLPGSNLWQFIQTEIDEELTDLLSAKLLDCCRKLSMMWLAGDKILETESEFYRSTTQDSPALFGEEAINLHYHLESMILFARSALDIASRIFGELLPLPFQRKRFDSFNDLVKAITKGEKRLSVAVLFDVLRSDPYSWLSLIADIEKGRSLRDKIVHQIGFPIEYMELNPNSEKESAVVMIDRKNFSYLPLPEFVNTLREGVVEGFFLLESICIYTDPLSNT